MPSFLENLCTTQFFCKSMKNLRFHFSILSNALQVRSRQCEIIIISLTRFHHFSSYLCIFQDFWSSTNMIMMPMTENNFFDCDFVKTQRFQQIWNIFRLQSITSIKQNSPKNIEKRLCLNHLQSPTVGTYCRCITYCRLFSNMY